MGSNEHRRRRNLERRLRQYEKDRRLVAADPAFDPLSDDEPVPLPVRRRCARCAGTGITERRGTARRFVRCGVCDGWGYNGRGIVYDEEEWEPRQMPGLRGSHELMARPTKRPRYWVDWIGRDRPYG